MAAKDWWAFGEGIPRLYAAASLKQAIATVAAGASGSIPRLYAAASLKHPEPPNLVLPFGRIPRLYAAASLKR